MTVEDAIAALREHWDDVVSRLDAGRAQELRAMIAEIGGTGHARAITRITELLTEELPPAHPVRRALARGYLYAAARPDWLVLREGLLTAGQVPAAAPGPGGDPGEILAEVTARLLRAPALTEDEVRLRGADPADPSLIRLDRPDGGRQWPSFQFAPGTGPLPVVQAVNEMLGAATDPLGAADWWLGANAWLDGRPSELVGSVPDELLVRAARAVAEEV